MDFPTLEAIIAPPSGTLEFEGNMWTMFTDTQFALFLKGGFLNYKAPNVSSLKVLSLYNSASLKAIEFADLKDFCGKPTWNVTCRDCDGKGGTTCEHCDAFTECSTCNGYGYSLKGNPKEDRFGRILGHRFRLNKLARIFEIAPEMEVTQIAMVQIKSALLYIPCNIGQIEARLFLMSLSDGDDTGFDVPVFEVKS